MRTAYHRGRRLPRAAVALLLASGLALLCGGCGVQDGLAALELGTVSLRNDTDLGSAPLTVQQFFIAPVGTTDPGPNRLSQELLPGAVVIVGLFPAGTYNAVAVLDTGANVNFPPMEVRGGEPTTFVLP